MFFPVHVDPEIFACNSREITAMGREKHEFSSLKSVQMKTVKSKVMSRLNKASATMQ